MRYFNYALQSDPILLMKVHKIIYEYKPLAVKNYKVHWEDALNDAYFHIVENYNPSKGDLRPYIRSVVDKIYLNTYNSKEVSSSEVYDLESMNKSKEEFEEFNPYNSLILEEENNEYDDSLYNCIRDFLPYFIKDSELFVTKDPSKRKLNYSNLDLFTKYSVKVIANAISILSAYKDEADYLHKLAKTCHVRNFENDRYKKDMDKTLVFVARIGSVVKCKAVRSNRLKCPYLLEIGDILGKLYNMFYTGAGIGVRKIHDVPVYCTFSGQIVFTKEDLFEAIERELIGSILALRHNFQVLYYVRGEEIIFTTSNEMADMLLLHPFGVAVYIPMDRLIMSKLEK